MKITGQIGSPKGSRTPLSALKGQRPQTDRRPGHEKLDTVVCDSRSTTELRRANPAVGVAPTACCLDKRLYAVCI